MAKQIHFTEHSLNSIADRSISHQLVETAINYPDEIVSGYDSRFVYMKKFFDNELNQQMLLRVIVEERSSELVVITVYKTSHIDRYLKESSQ
ncbi:MAG: DUF4258 domain-containing protein [Bacteroidota bacterium]|nr:DUF4258 domain-containing protein [Bacteroidota bacterium]